MKNNNILNTIGQTSLIKINDIFIKLETTNPSGSVKDRMANYIITQAEKRKELKKNNQIIEVTSGNTGIALAMIAALKGYRFTAVMPEHMSIARQKMMRAFGAKLILTPKKEDMAGAVKIYEKLVQQNPDAYLPKQFANPDNAFAHEFGLGQEILKQMKGRVDIFIAGAGTGGTLIGVARALKKVNPRVKIVVIEPAESAVLTGGPVGTHGIQGIGEGFVPDLMQRNQQLFDEVVTIKTAAAINMANKLAKEHGVLVGVSSGANFLGALKMQKKYGKRKRIVTLFPDRGERYL